MNIDPSEKEKFNKIAEEWWDPDGKFAPLHVINPLRSNYISEKIELQGIKALDVCLLYTSPSPRDLSTSRMPSSA